MTKRSHHMVHLEAVLELSSAEEACPEKWKFEHLQFHDSWTIDAVVTIFLLFKLDHERSVFIFNYRHKLS